MAQLTRKPSNKFSINRVKKSRVEDINTPREMGKGSEPFGEYRINVRRLLDPIKW